MDPSEILTQLKEQSQLTPEELAQLPRWALVTLAVRCARRAQPLFCNDWPDAPLEFQETLETVLKLTELSAQQGQVDNGLQEAAQKAGETANTAANLTARFASFTVTFAAVNAAHVVSAENSDNAVAFAQAAADACHKSGTFATARFSAFRGAKFGAISMAFNNVMRSDFNELLNQTRREGWTDETPIPTDCLGSLWPDGTPPGFMPGKP